jgi:signal transduction histidine kinase/CheY-like chemotaxis protein/HPt (histidine-containing phosphotransfer) domain-containing protein
MHAWLKASQGWFLKRILPVQSDGDDNPVGPQLEGYILATSAVLIVAINVVFHIQNWGNDPIWRWVPSYTLLAFILVLIEVNRRGNFKTAAWCSLLMGSVYNFSLFYVGTLHEPAICTMLLVALAGLILGPRSSFILLLLLCGIWGLHAYFEYRKWFLVELPQRGALYDIESLFFFGIFLVVLHRVTYNHLEKAWNRVGEARKNAEAARVRAEEATLAKSQFLANASHELRTPLSGIIGLLDLARRKLDLDSIRHDLKLAQRNAESLLAILNDLLDNSKLEAGKFTLENVPFGLRLLLEDHLSPLGAVAEAKGIRLELRVSDQVPDSLRGDPLRLRQVLINLVGNAIKFTKQGRVTLSVALAVTDRQVPNQTRLAFEVADTGMGMDDDAILRLFTAYEQADASIARQFGGTGLGLSIVRQLVNLMSGRMHVSSTSGEGTQFQVELPFETLGREEITTSHGHGLLPHSHRLRILVAEDGATNQVVVRGYLEGMGHRVEIVEDGQAACMELSQRSFDAIILDGRMPVMSGTEALKHIRNGGLPGHPVLDAGIYALALTANGMPADKEAFLAAGADGFLLKPLNEAELHGLLTKALTRQLKRGHHLEPMLDGAMDKDPSSTSLSQLEALLGSGKAGEDSAAAASWTPAPAPLNSDTHRKSDLREKMWKAWHSESPSKLEALRAALHDRRWSDVSFWAHALKGSSAYLDLTEIHGLCGELENVSASLESGSTLPVGDLERIASQLESAAQSTWKETKALP